MDFLKKLGNFLAEAVSIASGMGPLITPFLGAKGAKIETTAINDLTQMGSIIVMVESVIQTPGSGIAKLEAATPLILQVLRTSQAFSGMKVADEALAESGATDMAQGLAKFMKSIHPDEVKKA